MGQKVYLSISNVNPLNISIFLYPNQPTVRESEPFSFKKLSDFAFFFTIRCG